MADNVTLPGTGAVVAADDIDSVQYQKIKLVDGTADSTAVIPGTAENGLDVDVTRLPTDGDGAIGKMKLTGYDNLESAYTDAVFYDGALSVNVKSGAVDVNDGDGSLTVDGTVTANLSATDNAVLDAIQAAVEVIDNMISGSEAQVDVVTMPITHVIADSGTITAVTGITNVVHVDDNGGALTVDGTVTANLSATDNAVLDSIQAAVETIDNCISGSEAQVDVITMPAVVDNGGSVYAGAACTPKFAAIAAASSGNNTIVAAVSDKKIRVLALSLSASAAVNAKFQSAAGGTDITGLYYLAANGGMVLPYNKVGWFETAASALLNLNLSAANAVGGSITYIEV